MAKTKPELKSFIIRTNCEYSIQIDDVASAEEAMKKAEKIPVEAEWEQAWAPWEVTDEDGNEVENVSDDLPVPRAPRAKD